VTKRFFSRDARKRANNRRDATGRARVLFLTRNQNASLSPTDMSFYRASALGVALDVRARTSDVAAGAHRRASTAGAWPIGEEVARAFCFSASNRSSDALAAVRRSERARGASSPRYCFHSLSAALRQSAPTTPQVTVLSATISGLNSFCVSIVNGAVRYCPAEASKTALRALLGCESPDARICAALHVASACPNQRDMFLFSGCCVFNFRKRPAARRERRSGGSGDESGEKAVRVRESRRDEMRK
jgi:hypothetical protein